MVSHLLDGRTGCEQHAGFQHIVTAATGYLMQLRRTTLQRLTIWAPAAFIAFLTLVVLYFHPDILSPWIIGLIVAGVAGIGTYIFSRFVFSHIQRQEKEIIWRGEAMASINALGTEIISLLELDEILRSVAEKARQLLGTEVSTLYLLDEEGGLVPKALCGPQEAFQVGGNGRDAYSSWKTGQGLGLSLSFGKQGLKCPGIKEGYMRAHLSAPLQRGEKVVGVLWVADRSPRRFLPLESELLSLLAIQAAIAIENAGLREQLSNVAIIGERHRIAREIHDGLAQELAFFSLKLGELEGNASACPLPCPNLEGIRLMKEGGRQGVRRGSTLHLLLKDGGFPRPGIDPHLDAVLPRIRRAGRDRCRPEVSRWGGDEALGSDGGPIDQDHPGGPRQRKKTRANQARVGGLRNGGERDQGHDPGRWSGFRSCGRDRRPDLLRSTDHAGKGRIGGRDA